ncbi:response regulator [Sphingosinicellaceae bacterium]|nr:response regulator [Sphingosinicellaceae bacterium]
MQILFVEDDAMNRRVVRDMLRVGGVEMSEAADAETGLKLIDEEDYDLVLMDLRMPGVDGLTAIQRIRARGDVKSTIPIIVVTADTAANLRSTCLSNGADDLLLKPVAMEDLFEAIGRLTASRSSGSTVPI